MATASYTREGNSPHTRDGNSLLNLIEGLRDDVRNLFHQEVQLAKTEISEKVSYFGRNSVYMAIAGVIGYTGLILLLLSLSFLIASAFENMGLSTGMSLFLGFLVLALLCIGVGAGLFFKAKSAFAKASLAPEKTIETLREIKGGGLEQAEVKIYRKPSPPQPQDNRNSDQIKADIEHTRGRINREVTGIRRRLGWAQMAFGMARNVTNHPMRSVGIGVGTGLAGLIFMRVTRLLGRRRAA